MMRFLSGNLALVLALVGSVLMFAGDVRAQVGVLPPTGGAINDGVARDVPLNPFAPPSQGEPGSVEPPVRQTEGEGGAGQGTTSPQQQPPVQPQPPASGGNNNTGGTTSGGNGFQVPNFNLGSGSSPTGGGSTRTTSSSGSTNAVIQEACRVNCPKDCSQESCRAREESCAENIKDAICDSQRATSRMPAIEDISNKNVFETANDLLTLLAGDTKGITAQQIVKKVAEYGCSKAGSVGGGVGQMFNKACSDLKQFDSPAAEGLDCGT